MFLHFNFSNNNFSHFYCSKTWTRYGKKKWWKHLKNIYREKLSNLMRTRNSIRLISKFFLIFVSIWYLVLNLKVSMRMHVIIAIFATEGQLKCKYINNKKTIRILNKFHDLKSDDILTCEIFCFNMYM